ncbi:MAG: ABC-type transporter, periplasmic subunit [Gemmatimonadetes bacterium]|nr:ABC-type transporter, periplasmic subunit [Gemmatimonadota bacterium]
MRHPVIATLVLPFVLACSRGDASAGTRVVSVSKQINEFLYDIHAESVLVARDLTSVYPEQIKRLPSVGYHRGLSAEGIISMRPTMLLTDGNLGPDAVVAQVKKVGIPVVVLSPGKGLDSAQLLMARLGEQFHHQRQADSVLAQWRREMASALVDSTRWATQPKPRVLVMHFGQVANDYLALKRGTTADQVVQWAGGVNALDSVGGMLRLTPELIAKAAPDIIIATDVGFDRLGGVDKFAALPGVSLTPAGQLKRIHRVDESEVMYFGPRTPASLRKITAWLHPDSLPASRETQ